MNQQEKADILMALENLGSNFRGSLENLGFSFRSSLSSLDTEDVLRNLSSCRAHMLSQFDAMCGRLDAIIARLDSINSVLEKLDGDSSTILKGI